LTFCHTLIKCPAVIHSLIGVSLNLPDKALIASFFV
jgi:hypothetical protein